MILPSGSFLGRQGEEIGYHGGRAEESLGICELSYACRLWGRAEKSLGIRELSYAGGLWDAAEDLLDSRKLLYALGLKRNLLRRRELSSTVEY